MSDEQERRQRIYDRLYDVYQYSPKAQRELSNAGVDSIQLRKPRPFPLRRLLLAVAGLAGVVGLAVWWVR